MANDSITLVAVFHNEEMRLPGYFRNVRGAVDRMVVVDCSSTDRTAEICRKAGAEVVESPYRYFEPNVNSALDKVKGGWVLILDADERLSQGLKSEIRQAVKSKKADVFFIKRLNFLFDGFSTKSTINAYLPRLFRKGAVNYHPIPHQPPEVSGKALKLSGKFFHYAYMGVPQYVRKMEEYLFQMPVEYEKSGNRNVLSGERDRRVSLLFGKHGLRMLLLYPAFSTLNLLLRHGLLLDGMRGLIYSVCGGISAFLEEATYYQKVSARKNGVKVDWKKEYPYLPKN